MNEKYYTIFHGEEQDDYGKPIDVILKAFDDGTLDISSLFSNFLYRESKDVVGKRFLNHLKEMLPTNKFDSSKDWVRFDIEHTGGCMLGDPYYGLSYTMEIFNADTCLWLIYRNLSHDLEVKDQDNNIYIFSNWRELKNWFKQQSFI